MNKIDKHIINHNASLKEAMIKLNNIPDSLTLFVVNDKKKLIGTLTDGDIRRGLIKGEDLKAPLLNFLNKDFYYITKNNYNQSELETIRQKRFRIVPLLSKNFEIIKLYNFREMRSILPLDAVIMAGGKGERMLPLTKNTPKPLLKIGNKPIIEYNIDRLVYFGIDNIHITLEYLGKKIETFCSNKKVEANFNYHYENSPMGTIGSIKQIKNYSHDHLLIMNSDILTNIDYEDMYKEFLLEDPDILVASVPYNINLPYAIFETDLNSVLSFKEKPSYTYYANSGIYIMKKEVLSLIPDKTPFNATDLMEKLISKGLKLIQYPIRSYWLDIGNMEDYKKAQLDISHIDFT